MDGGSSNSGRLVALSSIVAVLASGLVGVLGWGIGWDAGAILTIAMPIAWVRARSRTVAAAIAMAYCVGVSSALLPAAIRFFGSSTKGTAVVLAAVVVWTLPWVALWGRGRRGLRTLSVLVITVVPPFGIVAWGSPLAAAGLCFPGAGAAGVVALGALVAWMASVSLPISSIAFSALIVAAATAAAPRIDSDLVGVNTQLGRGGRDYVATAELRAALDEARRQHPNAELLLPEAVAQDWETQRLLLPRSGARIGVTDGHSRNELIDVGSGRSVAHSRWPLPASMWRPWSRASVPAHWFERSSPGDHVLFCYEAFLTWPAFLTNTPSRVVLVGNLWFDTGGRIELAELEAVRIWARLWNVPYATAINR